jgi:hypothetical protein
MYQSALRDSHIALEEKHKFSVTCPESLFVESVPVPSEHEKYCVDISRIGRTRTDYVTHISHQMQKHKIHVMCPNTLLVEPHWAHPCMKIVH